MTSFLVSDTPISTYQPGWDVVSGVASGDDGHIHIATTNAATNPGAIVTFQNIHDPAPTTSDPWPGPGGYAVGIDTVGNNTYGVDVTQGLYVMLGDGPAISLLDGSISPITVGPLYAILGADYPISYQTTIIGDEINNGLWLLYPNQLIFWSIPNETTTLTISLSGNPVATAVCLDDTASTVFVTDSGNKVIWVIDAIAGVVLKSIDISSIAISFPLWNSSMLRTHNGFLWITTIGNTIAAGSTVPPSLVYQIEVSSGTIATLDITPQVVAIWASSIIRLGRLYVPGDSGTLLVNSNGAGSSLDSSKTILTDPNVDFIMAGVTPGDHFTQYVISNPAIPIQSVSQHQITLNYATFASSGSYQIVTSAGLAYTVAVFDATTGALIENTPLPAYSQGLPTGIFINKQKNAVYGMPFSYSGIHLYELTDPEAFLVADSSVTGNIDVVSTATQIDASLASDSSVTGDLVVSILNPVSASLVTQSGLQASRLSTLAFITLNVKGNSGMTGYLSTRFKQTPEVPARAPNPPMEHRHNYEIKKP